jgi:hypothetical protein
VVARKCTCVSETGKHPRLRRASTLSVERAYRNTVYLAKGYPRLASLSRDQCYHFAPEVTPKSEERDERYS